MHSKVDEADDRRLSLFVPDIAGPRAFLPASSQLAKRCGFGAACTGCPRCRPPHWSR